MTKLVILVSAALLAASCGKKSESSAGGGSDEVAGPAAPSGPSAGPAAPAAPKAAGGTKWLTIDLLKVEVEVPSCASVMSQDTSQASVVAAGDGCTAMALTFNNMGNQPEAFDNELKVLTTGLSPEFSRKDKTADGWVFAYRLSTGGDEARLHVITQYKSIQCVGETNLSDIAGATAMEHTCASTRTNK